MKSLAEKMRITEQDRVLILHAPRAWEDASLQSADRRKRTGVLYDHVLCFVYKQAELAKGYPSLKSLIHDQGKIWVIWPKGRRLQTDLNLDTVVKTVYSLGMVESVNLAVDQTWTALKFTWPKPGKEYSNHHAQLIRDPKHK